MAKEFEIFIPFFTTRAEGTGIGLSYSRQKLRAQDGTISFRLGASGAVFQAGLKLPGIID